MTETLTNLETLDADLRRALTLADDLRRTLADLQQRIAVALDEQDAREAHAEAERLGLVTVPL